MTAAEPLHGPQNSAPLNSPTTGWTAGPATIRRARPREVDLADDALHLLLGGDRRAARRASPRLERRRGHRIAIPWPLQLTPATADGEPQGPQLAVVGRFLSKGGVDFYSQDPLADRYVLLRFPPFNASTATASTATAATGNSFTGPQPLLVELRWCRFTAHGWYENGGRFMSAAGSGEG